MKNNPLPRLDSNPEIRERLLPEHGAAVNGDLAVQHNDITRLVGNQRIDLDQARVHIEIDLIKLMYQVAKLAHLLFVEAETKCQLPDLIILARNWHVQLGAEPDWP